MPLRDFILPFIKQTKEPLGGYQYPLMLISISIPLTQRPSFILLENRLKIEISAVLTPLFKEVTANGLLGVVFL